MKIVIAEHVNFPFSGDCLDAQLWRYCKEQIRGLSVIATDYDSSRNMTMGVARSMLAYLVREL